MTPAGPVVLPIAPRDLGDLNQMAGEFSAYLRSLGDPDSAVQLLTGERIAEAAFGADPVLHGHIARLGETAAGYLLYTRDYNTDFGIKVFHVCDLFVRDTARQMGVGRALMDRAAADCRDWGGKRLEWDVWRPNVGAAKFYHAIGGQDDVDLVRMHKDL
jgi:GNAT superfamily N-acetyltransferase